MLVTDTVGVGLHLVMVIIISLSLYCSHFLYNCSHSNKHGVPQVDLSNDSEASVDLSVELLLSSDRLAVERVIAKTFSYSLSM